MFCQLLRVDPAKAGILFPLFYEVYDVCKWLGTFRSYFVCFHITVSHFRHNADLSESVKHIKMLVRYNLPSVCIRLILSIYGVVCFQFTNFSFDDCENILLHHIMTKSQIGERASEWSEWSERVRVSEWVSEWVREGGREGGREGFIEHFSCWINPVELW